MRPVNFLISILFVIVLLIISSTFVEGWLVYPENGGIGLISAVAIPLTGLPNRRVYLAFNFEVHFGIATRSDFKNLLFWQKFLAGKKKRNVDMKELTDQNDVYVRKDNGYTRKQFYRVVEDHIRKAGLNGTGCLLRSICETSQNPYYEYNGVFGNVLHILFTPSSSKNENIASIYSDAEINGRKSQCDQYNHYCETSILDLVSKFINVNLSERKL